MNGMGFGMDFSPSRSQIPHHSSPPPQRAPVWGLSDLALTEFARPADHWTNSTSNFQETEADHQDRQRLVDSHIYQVHQHPNYQKSAPLSLPPRSPYSANPSTRPAPYGYNPSAESPPLSAADGEWLGSAAASALGGSLTEPSGFQNAGQLPPTAHQKSPITPPSMPQSLPNDALHQSHYSPPSPVTCPTTRNGHSTTSAWPFQQDISPSVVGRNQVTDVSFPPFSSASLSQSSDLLADGSAVGPQSLPSRPIPSPIGFPSSGPGSVEIGRLDLGSAVTSSASQSPQSPKQRIDHVNHETQHASRSCVLRNVAPGVDDDALRNILEAFGPVRELGAQQRSRGGRGSVAVTFFDLRHAKQVVKQLNAQIVQGRPLDVRFCSASEENVLISGQQHDKRHGLSDFNQGTLVVFNVDVTTRAEEIRRIFGAYGSIKEIRETPHKKHHKFIEFYDVRDAEQALRCLNKTELGGKKIKIEISRPGGSRVNGQNTSPGRVSSSAPGLGPASFPPLEKNGLYTPPNSPPRNGVSNSTNRMGSPRMCSSSKFTLNVAKVERGEDQRTALMVRNIPNKYNQRMLLATLEEHHHGHIDFFYLPIDFKNKCNVGYCFINFVQAKYIANFHREFHGKKWGKFNSEKVCEITYARIQGRSNLIAHFQNSSLMNEDPKCRPVIFGTDGEQKEFPVGPHVRTRRGPSARESKPSEAGDT